MEMDTMKIARQSITEISEKFPSMEFVEDKKDQVELSITIPIQEGIKKDIWLSLQNNDELTLAVGKLQVEWFPCTEVKNVRDFIDAASDYIGGKSRILEHYRGNSCVKAELQKPDGEKWKTVVTWSLMFWLPFFPKSTKVVSNA